MRFYCILHRNSLGHLLRTSRDNIRPPPNVLKRNGQYLCTFSMSIVEFVVILTKIWHTNNDF